MKLFLTEDSNKIQLDDVLQLKDSTLIAQSFYYVLGKQAQVEYLLK